MTQAILFDFFGTLVEYNRDRRAGHYPATHRAIHDIVPGLDGSMIDTAIEASFGQVAGVAAAQSREFSMQEVFQDLLHTAGASTRERQVDQLCRIYMQEWSAGIVPVAGVRDMLINLHHQYRLAIITNTHYPPVIHASLAEMDCAGLFELVMTSLEHGRPKPASSIFQATLAALSLAASEVTYVGDSLVEDFQGATACGISAFLVGAHARAPREVVIPSVLDLYRKL